MADRVNISVTPNSLAVTAGETTQATVTLRNSGQTVDQFTISLEGLKSGWYSLPVSSVALFPNDQDTLKIILSPPKAEASGGSYPFRVRVNSQENPADFVVIDLSVVINALPEVGLEILPQVSTGRKGHYHVAVTNPGSAEAPIELKASSGDARIRFTPASKSMRIPGGGKQEAEFDASLSWLTLFFGKEAAFQVAATMPGGADARTISARLVPVRWYRVIQAFLPWLSKPPEITFFKASTDDKREFKVSWSAKRVATVKLDEETVARQGERKVSPSEARSYALTAVNNYGSVTKRIEVQPVTVPQVKTSDRIKVALSQSQVKANAGGAPVPISVQLQNTGQIVDKFAVEIEGIDQAWFSRSASSVALMPQASGQAQIFFQPPKQKPVRNGLYPFAVTVRSQAAPDEATIVLGQLEILPLVEFKAAVQPYRVSARGKGTFRLNLSNTGVSETVLSLDATDLDEGLSYKFKDDHPTLPAWSTLEVPVRVKSRRGSLIGERKRYDITVSARAADGKTQTANCEYNHHPWMSSWRPILRTIRILIALAILVIAVYFILKAGGGWSVLSKSPQTWVDQFVNTVESWFSR